MLNVSLIFLGSGLGGILRYWLSNIINHSFNRQFPYGTLFVNVTGCFLMGFLFVFILERLSGLGSELRALLLIGFLGGYTTFSSFSIETINLFENGASFSGFLNILLSVMLCIIATWLGIMGGRQC